MTDKDIFIISIVLQVFFAGWWFGHMITSYGAYRALHTKYQDLWRVHELVINQQAYRNRPMAKAYQEVKRLLGVNAQHVRKGYYLQDITVEQCLDHVQEELSELRRAPDDITEIADILGGLLHYCVRMGWHLEKIEAVLLYKLALRFKESER